MSLLDDVSIVVTPNGYKAGELYAVIPVPTEGAEEVTSFTNGTTYPFTTFATSGNNITSAIVSSAFAGAASNGISVTSGEIYKVTFDYTKNSGDDLRVLFAVSANGAASAISNNVIISASGTYTEYFTITSTTTGYLQMGTGNSGHSLNASITNVSVKEYTSADMDVTRATDATRVDEDGLIEDVLSNVPRIDYTGGGCPHILAEPQSTNLYKNYNLLSAIGTGAVSLNNSISPDGTQNATKLTFGSSLNDGALLSVSGSPCVASTVYTFSFYAKSLVGDGQFNLRIDTNSQSILVNQNFTTTIDWVRYTHTFTSDATATSFGSNSRFRKVTASNEILFYGMQLEKLSYSTSIIPTSGSTVTRNQDIFTRDGIGSLINSTEGVLFLEIAPFNNDLTNRSISLSNSGYDNRIEVRYRNNGTQILINLISSSTTQFSVVYSLPVITNFNKIAVKYKVNDFALWVNGVEVATDISGSTPIGLNKLAFDDGGGGGNFYGKVKQLQVYDTALTDTQLAALTT